MTILELFYYSESVPYTRAVNYLVQFEREKKINKRSQVLSQLVEKLFDHNDLGSREYYIVIIYYKR